MHGPASSCWLRSLRRWRVSSERSKSGSRCSIARARRASGLRPSRASGLSGRLRSWRRWRTRLSSGRDAISRPGSGWCRGRIRPGGKQKLGPISKQGDRYLRRILVVGAIAVLRRAQENPGKYPWLTQLLARRPFKVVAVALANKMARMAWALLAHGGTYRAPELAETA